MVTRTRRRFKAYVQFQYYLNSRMLADTDTNIQPYIWNEKES